MQKSRGLTVPTTLIAMLPTEMNWIPKKSRKASLKKKVYDINSPEVQRMSKRK